MKIQANDNYKTSNRYSMEMLIHKKEIYINDGRPCRMERKKGHFCIIQYNILGLDIDWYCIIDDDLFIWKM